MDRDKRFESVLTDGEATELRHISVEIAKFMMELREKAKEAEANDRTRKETE